MKVRGGATCATSQGSSVQFWSHRQCMASAVCQCSLSRCDTAFTLACASRRHEKRAIGSHWIAAITFVAWKVSGVVIPATPKVNGTQTE